MNTPNSFQQTLSMRNRDDIYSGAEELSSNSNSPSSGVDGRTSPCGSTSTTAESSRANVTSVPAACLACRGRHLKCDGVNPCSRCLSSGSECVYVASRRGYKGPRRNSAQKHGQKHGISSSRTRTRSGEGSVSAKSVRSASMSSSSFLSPKMADSIYNSAVSTPLLDPELVVSNSMENNMSYFGPYDTPDTSNDMFNLFATQQHEHNIIHSPTPNLPGRCIDSFYNYFYAAHPFVLPKETLLMMSQESSVAPVLAVMRWIGSLHIPECPHRGRFFQKAHQLIYEPRRRKDGFLVQALLLLLIGLDGQGQQEQARQILFGVERIATEIGLNTREFATIHGRGMPMMEESWRRTWWELFVVEGLIAGVHRSTDFQLFDVTSDVALPCEEHEYFSGGIPEPIHLQDINEDGLSDMSPKFSSFTYRIQSARNLGKLLRIPPVSGPDDENLSYIETLLTNWQWAVFYIPNSGDDLRQLLRLNIGALSRMSLVWSAAERERSSVKGMAQGIYHVKKKHRSMPEFWIGITQEEAMDRIAADDSVIQEFETVQVMPHIMGQWVDDGTKQWTSGLGDFTTMGANKTDDADSGMDSEQRPVAEKHLLNTAIKNFTWRNVTVTVKDRDTKQPKAIVDDVQGIVEAGEICALMGPSGCGKTTLLNVLARRPTNASNVESEVHANGKHLSLAQFREISCFVEQEDALIGSLTVRETLEFSSRLATTRQVFSLSKTERKIRIDNLLDSFGLMEQANTLIGTPIRKGISGGQKRRVGVASQLITSPKLLFLDEPTSGLDSTASFEVVKYLREVARRNNLIVICSIHQPSTSTFNLFDKLLLLSGGKMQYFGPVNGVTDYYAEIGSPMPQYVNPAEHLLDLVNIDFAPNRDQASQNLETLQAAWQNSQQASEVVTAIKTAESAGGDWSVDTVEKKPSMLSLTLTLFHRSFIKSYRDVVAYGIRIAMYLGLAIMMGTVWLRLTPDQESIQPFINAIFFGSAFMSFMAVAYVPAFIEDRLQYVKEHQNGLYGAAELIVSNFFIGVPYLFLISALFSVISYWLSNFQPTVKAFFTWVLWLFLDLLAAESLVVFMTSLFPSFVISLALVAFANGLWMSVGGFMVPPTILNVFYKYVFHYWDYQKYVFQGMMVNEFAHRVYSCGDGCHCMYQSALADQCKIDGQAVLDQYGYSDSHFGRDVGIMLSIIAGYRLASWLALVLRR
ncbi:hypothetical protein F53441_3882 [Fusarium austroafricanum]|uniref:ABC transporter domain-containing protein n=1 Tax=Fusarium austroafricanum TaxID=2364996 RepID=A0A8H4P198_9HYPO|nr:hypothetical protein F53441_3882 [Fusarium austroafricanum]